MTASTIDRLEGIQQLAGDAIAQTRSRRLKYEYYIVLRVRAPSWKDAVLSRFISSEDKRLQEGKEKAEEVLRSLRDAGLKLKVKKHRAKDSSKLLMVLVIADLQQLEQQSHRLFVERWLQEEGIGDTVGQRGSEASLVRPAKPAMRVVRVGGLHYFAHTDSGTDAAHPAEQQHDQPQQQGNGSFKPSPADAVRSLLFLGGI